MSLWTPKACVRVSETCSGASCDGLDPKNKTVSLARLVQARGPAEP
jgi:hypothetical protein